jgi:hypothetical protein
MQGPKPQPTHILHEPFHHPENMSFSFEAPKRETDARAWHNRCAQETQPQERRWAPASPEPVGSSSCSSHHTEHQAHSVNVPTPTIKTTVPAPAVPTPVLFSQAVDKYLQGRLFQVQCHKAQAEDERLEQAENDYIMWLTVHKIVKRGHRLTAARTISSAGVYRRMRSSTHSQVGKGASPRSCTKGNQGLWHQDINTLAHQPSMDATMGNHTCAHHGAIGASSTAKQPHPSSMEPSSVKGTHTTGVEPPTYYTTTTGNPGKT